MVFGETSDRKKLEREMRDAGRLPPGQSLTLKWPVLHEGSVPRVDLDTWDFRIDGLVKTPVRLTWEEFNKLPKTEIRCDIHCVTRWSRFDNRFEGVLFTEVMKMVKPKPEAHLAMVHGENEYTTNLSLSDLMMPTTIFAMNHDGEPLAPEHGYPLRLVVPQLYFWKSVKWVRGFTLMARDEPGFWEQNGYHMRGDPWKEQRFDTDPQHRHWTLALGDRFNRKSLESMEVGDYGRVSKKMAHFALSKTYTIIQAHGIGRL